MTSPTKKKTKSPAKLEQKEYVVAFLDFLGASEKMKSPEESDDFLQKIKDIYDFIRKFANKSQRYNIANIKARMFSDNIVFAHQLNNSDQEENSEKIPPCFSVIAFAYTFMFESMQKGLWIRGGITIGDFAVTGNFIYGNALVRAYELENSSAIYPRILVDHKLIDFIKQNDRDDIIDNFLALDFDGEYYLKLFNELSNIYTNNNGFKVIEGIKKNIETELSKNNSDVRKRQKIYWIANKFNMYCEENSLLEKKIMIENESNLHRSSHEPSAVK